MSNCWSKVKTQLRVFMARNPDTQGLEPEIRDQLIDEFCEDLSGALSPEVAAVQALSPKLQASFYAAFEAWQEIRSYGAGAGVRRAALGVSVILDPGTIVRVGTSDIEFTPPPDNVIKLR